MCPIEACCLEEHQINEFWPLLQEFASRYSKRVNRHLSLKLGRDLEPWPIHKNTENWLKDWENPIHTPKAGDIYVVAENKDSFWSVDHFRALVDGFVFGLEMAKEKLV